MAGIPTRIEKLKLLVAVATVEMAEPDYSTIWGDEIY
jgi:hypothetical protein